MMPDGLRMTSRRDAALLLLFVVSCGPSPHASAPPPARDAAAAPVPDAAAVPAQTAGDALQAEATVCQTSADCELVAQRAEMERNGGPCCAVCGGYLALNRAYHARQPVCDSSTRGACPVSCAEGRPPPVSCEAGHCALVYPPVQATCQSDRDCVVVPRLVPDAPATGCRLACGQYVAGNREWDAWAAGLWQSASVTGVCAPDCVDRLLPDASCTGGQCVIRAPSVVRLVRVDLRTPAVIGPLSAPAIAGVVASAQARFAACQERPRSIDPIGYAGFEMQFVVGADGRASDVDPGELASHLPDVAACMTQVVGALQFPRPPGGGTVRVRYPMGAAFETR